MGHKKIYIRPRHLVFLWFGTLTGTFALFVTPIIMFLEISLKRSLDLDVGFSVFITVIFLITVCILIAWRRATFNRKDFVELAEKVGVKFLKKRAYHWIYSVAYGLLNDIYIFAKIDAPTFGYYPPNVQVSMETGIGSFGSSNYAEYVETSIRTQGPQSAWLKLKTDPFGAIWNPEYMEEVSQIELISLISGHYYDIDVVIKIEGGRGDIPRTNCPEINTALINHLKDTEHFYARLQFNKDCLRMTIIGGSWQGERFRRKILKGFEVFKEIHNELKKRYPVKSWNDWQVQWDRERKIFRLVPI